jgi:rare lipoprotein A
MRQHLPTSVLIILALLTLAGCGTSSEPGVYKLGQPYQVAGRWYYPAFDPDYDAVGVASWYGYPFHGRKTANGEVFDKDEVSAAHPTLPLPSIVRVTNLVNHKSMDIRVNDRGPFVGDRIIDLSEAAARELGYERRGTVPVRVQFLRLADDAEGEPPQPAQPAREPETRIARATPPPAPVPAVTPVGGAPVVVGSSQAAVCRGEFIQVGAFAEPVRAERLAAHLRTTLGSPARASPPAADALARVQIGPLTSETEVARVLTRLHADGLDGAFVVKSSSNLLRTC